MNYQVNMEMEYWDYWFKQGCFVKKQKIRYFMVNNSPTPLTATGIYQGPFY